MKLNEKLLNELINTIKDRLIRDEDNAGTALAKLRQRLTDLEKLTDFKDQDAYMHFNAILDDLRSFRWYWEALMDKISTLSNAVHTLRDPHYNPRFDCHGEQRVKEELALRDKYHGVNQSLASHGQAVSAMSEAKPRPPFSG